MRENAPIQGSCNVHIILPETSQANFIVYTVNGYEQLKICIGYSNAVHTSNLHLFAPIFLHYVTRHHFKLVLNICVAEANIAFLSSIDA